MYGDSDLFRTLCIIMRLGHKIECSSQTDMQSEWVCSERFVPSRFVPTGSLPAFSSGFCDVTFYIGALSQLVKIPAYRTETVCSGLQVT